MGFGTVMKVLRKVQKYFWSQTFAWLSLSGWCRWAWYSLVISHQDRRPLQLISARCGITVPPSCTFKVAQRFNAGLTAEALFQSRCFCLSWLWNKCLTFRADLHWALRQKHWIRQGSRPGGFCPPNVEMWAKTKPWSKQGKRLWRVCVLHGPGLAFILQLSDWIS